jgi:hypothetical protein
MRLRVEHREQFLAEVLGDTAGQRLTDAFDLTRGKIALKRRQPGRLEHLVGLDPELPSVARMAFEAALQAHRGVDLWIGQVAHHRD